MIERRSIQIRDASGAALDADLAVPDEPAGVVIFAHGSGSSRHSPRNAMVAARLQERRLATVLIDLLTLDEETADARSGHLRFDINLLAGRLAGAAGFARDDEATAALPIGFFGASTGAAAALVAAAEHPAGIAAIVSRGGRPDLAGAALAAVTAPTLLLVGELDEVVIGMNREAYAQMTAPRRLDIIAGATHLFEQPGALNAVAASAGDWFTEHFAPTKRAAR